ncbi:MAG: deoxyribonuclease IV [Nitrospirae bacterium]|nr:deoxyribonuclease IV [Nitrospirota bacterium]
MRRLGVHVSVAGGIHLSVERAKELGCTAMQIFSHNPRGWAFSDITESEAVRFRKLSDELNVRPVFIHSSYLINLASPTEATREKSISLLSYELRMADLLGIDYVVLHPGKAAGQDFRTAVKRTKKALALVHETAQYKSGILIENTAGQMGDISSTMPMIADIAEGAPAGLIKGICFDTCHGYAAGYDIADDKGIRKLERELKEYLSPLKAELIHLNDAKKGFASGVDRHEHIGEGSIGIAGFRRFLSSTFLRKIPLILETPKKDDGDDKRNLGVVREILKEVKNV